MKLKPIWAILKDTFSEWNEDKAPRLAAALAYYAVFSIAPLMVVVIAIAGFVFGRDAAEGQIIRQIQDIIGPVAAKSIQSLIEGASRPSTGIRATVLGIIILLFGATGVFGQLQDGLNTIWEVAPRPGRGIMGIVKTRFLSFIMVFGIGLLLLSSLTVSAGMVAIGAYLGDRVPGFGMLTQVLNFVISFAVITLLFAMIFKFLPDVKIAWSDVWIGAAATALLFTLGSLLIGIYLGYSKVASVYGAAGSLVILLLWVYYSAQILFLGAEFTQVYANRYGTRFEPTRDAVAMTEEARAEQGIPHTEEIEARKE